MYSVELRIRMETFFGEQIEKNNITSNECKFYTLEEFEDGTVKMQFVSNDSSIIEKIKKLHSQHDYSILSVTEEEKKIKELQEENKSLGQMITELELGLIELSQKVENK